MLYVGTSGYSFKEWVGPFYPPGMKGDQYLSFYASRLRTVEINYTFRRFPTRGLAASWAAQTPESFKFSFKVHQGITHVARLKDVGGRVKDFLRALQPLGPRLGLILFQLPPFLPADPERLEKLLAELPPGYKFAFEFRHPSWNHPEYLKLLRSAGAALCASELQASQKLPPSTAPHAYFRLREVPPFSGRDKKLLLHKMQEVLSEVEELYFYIKHDAEGLSPLLAMEFQSLEDERAIREA